MTDSNTETERQASPAAPDELRQLSALLHRLEHAENLSLDELDAVILQADAAYRSRLARLERTRQMIAQLGTLPNSA